MTIKKILLPILAIMLLCSCKKDVNVSFTWTPENPKAGESVTFVNTSSGGESWLWLFGEGSTSTYRSPSHIFTGPGEYTVTLQADAEARYMTSKTIVIGDTLPSINIEESVSYMTQTALSANVYNPNGLSVEYRWQFSENVRGEDVTGGIATTDKPNVYFTKYGVTETITLTVTVEGQNPQTVSATTQVLYKDGTDLYFADINMKLYRLPMFDIAIGEPAETGITFVNDIEEMCANDNAVFTLLDDNSVLSIDKTTGQQTTVIDAGVTHIDINEGELLWTSGAEIINSDGVVFNAEGEINALAAYYGGIAFSTSAGIFNTGNHQISTNASQCLVIDIMRSLVISIDNDILRISTFTGNVLAEFEAIGNTKPLIHANMLYYANAGKLMSVSLGMPTRVIIGIPAIILPHSAVITAIAM